MTAPPGVNVPPTAQASDRNAWLLRALAWWTGRVTRLAPLIVLLFVAGAGAGGFYTANHLGINTDTEDMLSEDLPWRVDNERHKQAFPHYTDNILVVIEGGTVDVAADSHRRLGERLRAEPERFEAVYLSGGGPFFERKALLYTDVENLGALAEGLEESRPWLSELEDDPSLPRFLAIVDSLLAAGGEEGVDERAAGLLGAIGAAFEASMVDRARPLPWRDLMSGREAEPEERRRYIDVKPRLDFERLFPGEPAIERIRALADSLGLTARQGVSVRLTGFIPMSDEELRSAVGGLRLAAVLALLMVGAILYAGLRSGRLIASSLLTLLVGLVFTASFAALAVGHLNLISMAFAVLYIGLGIDYAIHYCLRYRELRSEGAESRQALEATAGDVGASLFLSAVTTAACFYAFVPTDFKGVSELGLIGGTGMLISFATTVTFLPALLSLAPFRPKPGEKPLVGGALPDGLAVGLARHRRAVLVTATAVGVLSLWLLPRARFDRDPLSLRDPRGEATATFLELLADTARTAQTVSVVVRDEESAASLAARLERLEAVKAAVFARDFVPELQGEKLELVARIARAAGSPPEDAFRSGLDGEEAGREPPGRERPGRDSREASPTVSPTEGSNEVLPAALAAVESFRESVRRLEAEGEAAEIAAFTTFEIRNWQRWLAGLPERGQRRALGLVEESLLGGLDRGLRQLRASLDPGRVTFDSLPRALVERWVAADGAHRVEVIPRNDLAEERALIGFVRGVRQVAPHATGEPVINVSAGEAVVQAFRRALVGAAVATFVLLLISLRSLADASRVMIPLLLAGAVTAAATVVFDLPFNYANVIALPLLLGVGVDNGIHMVHRGRANTSSDRGLLATSTARAVLYAGLTTIFSFGNLAFSRHPGTASMGRLLTIGMLAVLVSTLAVLPALARSARPWKGQHEPGLEPHGV